MKTLTVSVLICAMMSLARAGENQLVKKASSCPLHWTEIKGRCFLYISGKMDWADAEKNCLTKDAHLASVHSEEEYHGIQEVIRKDSGGFPRTWLGGSDCQNEDVWLWSDGTPFKYRYHGRFDNRWWRQHCLQMNYGRDKLWDDVQCSSRLPSVCARKLA